MREEALGNREKALGNREKASGNSFYKACLVRTGSIGIRQKAIDIRQGAIEIGNKLNRIAHFIYKNIKTYLMNYDQVLLFVAIALTVFGIYLQFDIATELGSSAKMRLFTNQLLSLGVAFIVFIVFLNIPDLSKFLYKYSFLFICLLTALLVFVLLFGITKGGGTRWIRLLINFQPSQLVHPVMIIFFAKYFDRLKGKIKETGFLKLFYNFPWLVVVSLMMMFLIFRQKHLSILIVLSLTLLAMFFIAEFKKSLIVALLLLMMGSFYVVTNMTQDHRSERMEIFAMFSPYHKHLGIDKPAVHADPYQIKESLTAISQGGLIGTGSYGGRAKHNFLPVINSDYIFALIGEQFGFFGGLLTILAFCLFLFRTFMLSVAADSFFNSLVIIGMGLNIFITAMVNIGVAISALPSTGLTLPFISHGGTALVVNAGMLAVILNLSKKRKVLECQTKK